MAINSLRPFFSGFWNPVAMRGRSLSITVNMSALLLLNTKRLFFPSRSYNKLSSYYFVPGSIIQVIYVYSKQHNKEILRPRGSNLLLELAI